MMEKVKPKKPLKEIKCINCNRIVAFGYFCEGHIEIKCPTCKTMNTIVAEKQEPYGDRLNYNKKSA